MKIYYGIDELADYIKLSKSSIYKWTMSRRIPHIKAGKKLLFEKQAIDEWLQKQEMPILEDVGVGINSLIKSKK